MPGPLQTINHSDPGKLAVGQSKVPQKAKPTEPRCLSAHTAQKNTPADGFDPPLAVVPTRNAVIFPKKSACIVRPHLTGLLVKNKNLSAELRNLQNKLSIKEYSLQEMKSELQNYKENNVQQSFQIMSLKEDIKDLEKLIASLTRLKSLKNTNIQSLERGNWDLTERITELEKHLRIHLVEREKAERKADLLEKKLASGNRSTPYMKIREQDYSLDSFMMKGSENLEQEIQMLTKRLDKLHHHYEESTQELSQSEEKHREEKRPLKHLEEKFVINDLSQEQLDLNRNKESSRTKNTQIDERSKMFKQLEKDSKQHMLLNIQHNLQTATTRRLEEKVQKLQKQLSDLKLSNKNMKTQLTRVNVLKDKTIEKLRKSLTNIETIKGETIMKTDNLKTTYDSTEQQARMEEERDHQTLDVISEVCTAKTTVEEVSGQEELANFQETILKMLGFNTKTSHKEIINHLRLIIQVYEDSNKSKTGQAGQDNE
ncbi:coiled-coil domain-containing protein 170-like [Erinaceus europaeus]|uniref:Coiled-coil domain-containing protein 170-like n=1 Tax=Erinaceus europaeus TaxID=9365 RepID=A0ABM3W2P1_ERIEU|nr:coiled-coil domain-containing protein 170-like [Erinaceus europaeus]XP_060030840.1 coiled-coil domain-containing protein 170-like [Erinaceus europaeus]